MPDVAVRNHVRSVPDSFFKKLKVDSEGVITNINKRERAVRVTVNVWDGVLDSITISRLGEIGNYQSDAEKVHDMFADSVGQIQSFEIDSVNDIASRSSGRYYSIYDSSSAAIIGAFVLTIKYNDARNKLVSKLVLKPDFNNESVIKSIYFKMVNKFTSDGLKTFDIKLNNNPSNDEKIKVAKLVKFKLLPSPQGIVMFHKSLGRELREGVSNRVEDTERVEELI